MSHIELKGSKLQNYPSIMAKRSQRRSPRYEKDQAGCISGFMSIFDFRHGRSTRKLLANRKRESRHTNASTSAGSSSTVPAVTRSDDKCDTTKEPAKSERADAVQTSVKKLMEEDMIHEQFPEKQINVSREGPEEFNPEDGSRARKHRRRRSRGSRKSIDMDIYDGDSSRNMEPENICQQNSDQKVLDNIDLETIIEELRQIHHRSSDSFKNDLNSDVDVPLDRAEEKLNAAIKVFMSHKLTNNRPTREDGSIHHSKEFIDALQTISSNKELFLKRLQDPNSMLMKLIKDFEGASIQNEAPTKSEPDEPITHKPRKFFRRRSKSQDSYPLEGDETRRSSSKIIILKPGPTGSRDLDNGDDISASFNSRYSFDNKVQGDKHGSHFSFSEIKRLLKHAIGKDHQNHGAPEKGNGGENFGWSSPNRNHFYTERFAKPSIDFKRGDKIAKSKDVEVDDINDSSENPKKGVSNLYIEAKKHLSEMLNNGEEDAEVIKRQSPKSLGKILSLPDYKESPRSSPEKDTKDSVITATMILSPRGISHEINDGTNQNIGEKQSPSEQYIDNQIHKNGEDYHENEQFPDANCSATCEIVSENLVEDTTSFRRDDMAPEEILEIDETIRTQDQEEDENEILNLLEISITSSPSSKDVEYDNSALCNEEKPTQRLKLESFEQDQESSSPASSIIKTNVEDPDEAITRTDRPSPISVLEQLFSEDDISPVSTTDRQVELVIHPRKIDFEDQSFSICEQGISTIGCMEDGESPFEYVEAVLLGSGLNWDDFLLRWLSSDQILDPSLFDEVELFSSRHHDQKLLFDCTNEVLKEVCDRYFGSFIDISFVKQSIRPAPRGMNLINEIWEGVEWRLVHHPPPKSLDQLVKIDLTNSKMWMNPHLDIEHVRTQMEEAIFKELVEDTITSFVACTDFPAGSHEIEISS